MQALPETRKGELYIFGHLLFGSLFPVIVVLSFATLSGLASLGWSVALAAVFFAIVLTYRRKWTETLNPTLWKYTFFITLFNAILFYGLYYVGLERSSAGNAAVLNLFEIFTTFLFFNVLKRVAISREHSFGAILMVIGALIVLAPRFVGVNSGDLLILFAMFFSPVGNYYQQLARRIASSEMILFLRSICSVPIILVLATLTHTAASLADLQSAVPFLLINGILVFGLSKIWFIESIHRISVTKAIAITTGGPFLTLLFAWFLLGQAPNVWQLSSLVPLVLGTLLLTDQISFRRFF